MQQSKVVETWVGLFVALGMASLFFLAMKVSNLGDLQTKADSYMVTAHFQNAGSLKPRAPVSMAGVRIGRVDSIRFDSQTYEAVVEMRIDPQYNTIPTDTTASVLTAGLLGEQYVGLSAGGSDEFLKEGDDIELTQSALVLEEVISRFLFNKAESGGEKKASPSADAADADAEASFAEEMPAKPTPQDKGEEEASPHKPLKSKAAEAPAGHAHPVAATQPVHGGKPTQDAHAAQKPKAAGKDGEETNPTHKSNKPAK